MTAPEPVGLTDGEREALVGLPSNNAFLAAVERILADRLAAERAAHEAQQCPALVGHESYGETRGDGADYCSCGRFLGIDFPPEQTRQFWVEHRAEVARAHEAQVQAGDRLREAVEALAEVYASRVQMLSQPRFKSTADGRERNVWGMAHADLAGALAAAAPTPPQDDEKCTCDRPRLAHRLWCPALGGCLFPCPCGDGEEHCRCSHTPPQDAATEGG